MSEELVIGLVSISDRASAGVYKDEGIPALKEWLGSVIASPKWRDETRLIADEQPVIEKTLKELVDERGCHLVLTTGGTGPAVRDVTPEATLAVADKVMPGFGEQMRAISLKFVPTAILVAALAAARPTALITLPSHERTIVLSIDVSLSMRAADVLPTRIAAAQAAAKDFIKDQPGDVRLGIVSFAGTAAVIQQPTHD